MSHIEHHLAPPGMTPGNGYSHAVSASGRLVAIAGQVAMDEHGELVGPGDPAAQTERVFENLRLALAAADATFADVVKFGVFVTDMSILPVIREIRDRHVDRAQPPASTAVQVVALFRPGYLVEIEALAVVRDTADLPRSNLERYAEIGATQQALTEFLELAERAHASSGAGGRTWQRDDVYDRPILRDRT